MNKEETIYIHTHICIYNECVYIHTCILLITSTLITIQSYKRMEKCHFAATWMGLGVILVSDISQTKKDKYCMISLLCGILKNNKNEHIYKTEADS